MAFAGRAQLHNVARAEVYWRWSFSGAGGASRTKHRKLDKAQSRPGSVGIWFSTFSRRSRAYTLIIMKCLLSLALNIFVFSTALFARRWKTLTRWIIAQLVLVAAYAPWVLFGTNRVTNYGEASAQQSVSLLDQFSRTLATFVLSDTVPDTAKSLLWLPLALALLAVLVFLVRQDAVARILCMSVARRADACALRDFDWAAALPGALPEWHCARLLSCVCGRANRTRKFGLGFAIPSCAGCRLPSACYSLRPLRRMHSRTIISIQRMPKRQTGARSHSSLPRGSRRAILSSKISPRCRRSIIRAARCR